MHVASKLEIGEEVDEELKFRDGGGEVQRSGTVGEGAVGWGGGGGGDRSKSGGGGGTYCFGRSGRGRGRELVSKGSRKSAKESEGGEQHD